MKLNNTFRLIIDCFFEENIVVTVLAKLVSLFLKSEHAHFSSFMLKAMNEVSGWSRCGWNLSTVDGSCIPWTEVVLWAVNGSSLACYPSPLSESQS